MIEELLDSVIERLLRTIDPDRFVSSHKISSSPQTIAAEDRKALDEVLPAMQLVQNQLTEPWYKLPHPLPTKLRLARLLVASVNGPVDPSEAVQNAKLFEVWNHASTPFVYFSERGALPSKQQPLNEINPQVSGVLDTLILAQTIDVGVLFQCFYGCWRYFVSKALGSNPDLSALKVAFFQGRLRDREGLDPPASLAWLSSEPKFCKALFEGQKATLRELINGRSIDTTRGNVFKFVVQVYASIQLSSIQLQSSPEI